MRLQKKNNPISLALHTSVCSRSLNFFPVYLLHHLMSVPCAPQYIYQDSKLQAFLCVFVSLVLFGAVRQLSCSVRFGQNSKTPLQLVTTGWSGQNSSVRCMLLVQTAHIASSTKQKTGAKTLPGQDLTFQICIPCHVISRKVP